MAFCTNCGKQLGEGYTFCPECGTKAVTDNVAEDDFSANYKNNIEKTKLCKKCGAEMPDDAFYCLCCGNTFDSEVKEEFEQINATILKHNGAWRNKWISLILCILFGWLGIHRFYEGKVFTGILYFFTLGLLGVGWFIDIIRIVLKSNPYRAK